MGCSTRGTGRNHDGLNDFGSVTDYPNGMVCDYSTCNRKCKKCCESEKPPEHESRKNCYGSAKAMEPRVAKKLVVDSAISNLKTLKLEC
jgi:hypothetical protein